MIQLYSKYIIFIQTNKHIKSNVLNSSKPSQYFLHARTVYLYQQSQLHFKRFFFSIPNHNSTRILICIFILNFLINLWFRSTYFYYLLTYIILKLFYQIIYQSFILQLKLILIKKFKTKYIFFSLIKILIFFYILTFFFLFTFKKKTYKTSEYLTLFKLLSHTSSCFRYLS